MSTPTMCETFGAEVNQALFMFAPEYMGGVVEQVSYGDRDGCRYQKDDLIIVSDGNRVTIPHKNITTYSVYSTVGKCFYKP